MRLLQLAILVLICWADSLPAQSVTRSTFNALTRVQQMMENEQYEEAKAELLTLIEKTANVPYDNAVANQYLAHASIVTDDVVQARASLEVALSVAELPPQLRTDLSLFYGTILLGDGEFELARDALEEWWSGVNSAAPGQIFSLAYANYMSGNVERGRVLVEQAISLAPQPSESWYQAYYRMLFDLREFDLAEDVLKGMLVRNPDSVPYWRLLVSHYLQRERSNEALAAFMIAHNNGLIERESDFAQIVSLYGYIDVPEKGARLLQEFIADGRLESDADTLKQLGNLWLLARERAAALTVLSEAAELAPDGRTWELLGSIHFEDEAWVRSYDAYQRALEAGGLEDTPRIWMLAGISAFRAGENENARDALETAAESEEYRDQAESLLEQIDDGR